MSSVKISVNWSLVLSAHMKMLDYFFYNLILNIMTIKFDMLFPFMKNGIRTDRIADLLSHSIIIFYVWSWSIFRSNVLIQLSSLVTSKWNGVLLFSLSRDRRCSNLYYPTVKRTHSYGTCCQSELHHLVTFKLELENKIIPCPKVLIRYQTVFKACTDL